MVPSLAPEEEITCRHWPTHHQSHGMLKGCSGAKEASVVSDV